MPTAALRSPASTCARSKSRSRAPSTPTSTCGRSSRSATDEVEVEEVYVQTRKLLARPAAHGRQVLQRHRLHQSAASAPVGLRRPGAALRRAASAARLDETGVQLTWLPLPVYALLGVEALQGENEALRLPARRRGSRPASARRPGRGCSPASLKVAPDLGYDHALQVGASFAVARSHQELHDHGDGSSADGQEARRRGLQGTCFLGLDLVWKYDSPTAVRARATSRSRASTCAGRRTSTSWPGR